MDTIPPEDKLLSMRLHHVVPGILADQDPTESVTPSSSEIKHHLHGLPITHSWPQQSLVQK